MNASFCTNFTSKPPDITLPTIPPVTVHNPMSPVIITQEDVFKILRSLNSNKAAGPDNLHPRLLIESAAHISLPLSRIFNMSLAKKSVPNDWRTANIIPIFKKGDKDNPGNYRPISLTSAICKIMEGIINHALINYLEENTLISDRQHGFRRGRSIDTNFIQSYDHATKILDMGKPVDIILLDQAKAFDKVEHSYLLLKLKAYQVHEDVIDWIGAFLTGRSQRVMIYTDNGDPVFSSTSPVISGVPQGTILGPTLFSIYINDCTTYLCNLLTLYADDCKLIGPAETEEERACIQLDLDRLSSWSSTWALQFNATKCKVLHLGHNNPHHPYHIGCDQLEAVAEERDLGVIVDKDLKFHSHTQAQVAKANRALGLIKRSFVTRKSCVVIKLYKSLVRPHLEFGLTLAFPQNKMDTRALESVQRRATKLVRGLNNVPYQDRLGSLRLPTLTYRRYRGDVIMARKIFKSGHLNQIFTPSLANNSRGHSLKLHLPGCRRRERRGFFSIRVVPLWNSLSESTIQAETPHSFKAGVDRDWERAEWRLDWEAKPT